MISEPIKYFLPLLLLQSQVLTAVLHIMENSLITRFLMQIFQITGVLNNICSYKKYGNWGPSLYRYQLSKIQKKKFKLKKCIKETKQHQSPQVQNVSDFQNKIYCTIVGSYFTNCFQNQRNNYVQRLITCVCPMNFTHSGQGQIFLKMLAQSSPERN